MNCGTCGHKITKSDQFCQECGSAMLVPSAHAIIDTITGAAKIIKVGATDMDILGLDIVSKRYGKSISWLMENLSNVDLLHILRVISLEKTMFVPIDDKEAKRLQLRDIEDGIANQANHYLKQVRDRPSSQAHPINSYRTFGVEGIDTSISSEKYIRDKFNDLPPLATTRTISKTGGSPWVIPIMYIVSMLIIAGIAYAGLF